MPESHHNNVPVSSDIVEIFLKNQSKEIELKTQIEENRRQSSKYNYELAKQSLQAQSNDRKEEREHQKVLWKWGLSFCAVLAFIFFLFLGFALYLGKENFLIEVAKIFGYGGSGFFAGFSLNKYKEKETGEKQA